LPGFRRFILKIPTDIHQTFIEARPCQKKITALAIANELIGVDAGRTEDRKMTAGILSGSGDQELTAGVV
jgi:hypothetical protein